MPDEERPLIARDRLPARSAGRWVSDKAYYLERYCSIFTKGVGRKWAGKLAYVDLFSGPGRSIIRETSEEIDGSPLVALKYDFASYVFVDRPREIEFLRQRLSNHPKLSKVKLVAGDCNEAIDQVLRASPADHLTLTFIDPTGLQIHFETIQKLVRSRRVDLLMTVQFGMAIRMNIHQYLQAEAESLGPFLGMPDWRTRLGEFTSRSDASRKILELYEGQLRHLGYETVKDREIEIHSDERNLLLYFIILASRNPRAHDFWRKITQIQASGQRRLL